MAGRPSKATPERIAAICLLLIEGNTRTASASLVGIDRATLYRWTQEDVAFRNAVERAEDEAQARLLATIRLASTQGMTIIKQNGDEVSYPGQWTAAAWMLERRWPDRYGRRDHNKVELTGKDGGPIETADVPLVKDDHEKRLLRDAIAREIERVPA